MALAVQFHHAEDAVHKFLLLGPLALREGKQIAFAIVECEWRWGGKQTFEVASQHSKAYTVHIAFLAQFSIQELCRGIGYSAAM